MCIGLLMLLTAAGAMAEQAPTDLSDFLPESGEVAGWTPDDAPKGYRGDGLYQMINGGADIFHEYGFIQVLRAEYVDARGKPVKLEIYEMGSAAAAYGIYTFNAGDGGKALAIGQEALLGEYYLNFWKGNLMVTLIGLDSEEETVQGIVNLAKAVDARVAKTGERPELAALLLRDPPAFSQPRYIRGPLGVMNSYIFDTKDIFRVREGMIGTVGDNQAFVFRYADERESAEAYEQAATQLYAGSRFTKHARQGNRYSMVGRDKEIVEIKQSGRYIAIVIGQDHDKIKATSERLVEKLKGA
jgi:hypothetical protein